MNTVAGKKARARLAAARGSGWLGALAVAIASAEAGALALRPRTGLIEPDPVRLEDNFDAEEVRRARAYSRPQLALGLAGGLLDAAMLAAVAARLPARRPRRPLLESALVAVGLTAATTLAGLPLAALARRRALRAGLATQSWGGWGRDIAKSTAIGGGLAAGAAPLGVALMRRSPRQWWLPGSAVAVGAGTLLTFLAPVLLDPIFNDFSPLPEGDTRSDVLELARRAGVHVREVYSIDASRRTTAANAYVTGLGRTKRVVLFDTLLAGMTRDETRLVVAHELAHVHHRDVPRGLLHSALMAPSALAAAARLSARLDRAPEPGPASLAPLALALGVVTALTGLLRGQLSRRVEARADAFALQLTDAPEPFIAFERKLVRQNLADPDPPAPLRLLGSHPPVLRRIGIAHAYARSRAAGARAEPAAVAGGATAA